MNNSFVFMPQIEKHATAMVNIYNSVSLSTYVDVMIYLCLVSFIMKLNSLSNWSLVTYFILQ